MLLSAQLSVAQLALPPAPQKPQPPPTARDQGEVPQGAPPKADTLPPGTPVIVIHGYCEPPKAGSPPSKSGCTTVITRAEFEKLANALQPNMPPQVRKQLATQYPEILYMAQQARKRGLEQNPHYLQVLKFTKMELLRIELERTLQDEAEKVPDSVIADFYKKNPANFEQTSFRRVFIPKTRQGDTPKEGATPTEADAVRKNSEAEMSKVAADLRTRAVAGEDIDKLQQAAYDAAGVKATPPSTLNANVRRGNLPATQSSIFDLRPGEVSTVLNDPTGFYFFKVVSKTPLALGDVKDEIRTTLRTQREQAVRQSMLGAFSSDINKAYFGDAPAPPPGPSGAPHPPAQPKE